MIFRLKKKQKEATGHPTEMHLFLVAREEGAKGPCEGSGIEEDSLDLCI